MTKPARSDRGKFSKREIVLFVLVMIAATVLTVIGTYYFLHAFVLHDPADPVKKAGRLSFTQEREVMKAK
jgi:hypothetical protein